MERASEVAGRVATIRGRVELLVARRREDELRGLPKRARRSGGRRLDDGVVLDPDLRGAVEAVLGDATHGYIVDAEALAELAGERGVAVAGGRAGVRPVAPSGERGVAEFLARVGERGGGRLTDALRSDPAGVVSALVARAAWVPDVAAVIALQASLPIGWSVTTRDGSAVAGPVAIRFGRPEGALERVAEEQRLARELGRIGRGTARDHRRR